MRNDGTLRALQFICYVVSIAGGLMACLGVGWSTATAENCVLDSDMKLSNVSERVTDIELGLTKWGSMTTCSFATYAPASVVIYCIIWLWFYVLLSDWKEEGTLARLYKQPEKGPPPDARLLFPSLLFAIAAWVVVVACMVVTVEGRSQWCQNVEKSLKTSCSYVAHVTWVGHEDYQSIYNYLQWALIGNLLLFGTMTGMLIITCGRIYRYVQWYSDTPATPTKARIASSSSFTSTQRTSPRRPLLSAAGCFDDTDMECDNEDMDKYTGTEYNEGSKKGHGTVFDHVHKGQGQTHVDLHSMGLKGPLGEIHEPPGAVYTKDPSQLGAFVNTAPGGSSTGNSPDGALGGTPRKSTGVSSADGSSDDSRVNQTDSTWLGSDATLDRTGEDQDDPDALSSNVADSTNADTLTNTLGGDNNNAGVKSGHSGGENNSNADAMSSMPGDMGHANEGHSYDDGENVNSDQRTTVKVHFPDSDERSESMA